MSCCFSWLAVPLLNANTEVSRWGQGSMRINISLTEKVFVLGAQACLLRLLPKPCTCMWTVLTGCGYGSGSHRGWERILSTHWERPLLPVNRGAVLSRWVCAFFKSVSELRLRRGRGNALSWDDDGCGAAEVGVDQERRGRHVARASLWQQPALGTSARAGSGVHHQKEQVQNCQERRAITDK